MSDSQHASFDGLAALYAVGALSEDDRTAFETHLEVCLECVGEVKSLLPVTHALVHGAPPLDAPGALRARVLGHVTGTVPAPRDMASAPLDAVFTALDESDTPTLFVKPPRRGPGALFWLAAHPADCGGRRGWLVRGGPRQAESRPQGGARHRVPTRGAGESCAGDRTDRNGRARGSARGGARNRHRSRRPAAGSRGTTLAPRASARALWNNVADMVFIATGLPSLPAGDVYQLWFGTPSVPISWSSAALLEPDADGDATVILEVRKP